MTWKARTAITCLRASAPEASKHLAHLSLARFSAGLFRSPSMLSGRFAAWRTRSKAVSASTTERHCFNVQSLSRPAIQVGLGLIGEYRRWRRSEGAALPAEEAGAVRFTRRVARSGSSSRVACHAPLNVASSSASDFGPLSTSKAAEAMGSAAPQLCHMTNKSSMPNRGRTTEPDDCSTGRHGARASGCCWDSADTGDGESESVSCSTSRQGATTQVRGGKRTPADIYTYMYVQ